MGAELQRSGIWARVAMWCALLLVICLVDSRAPGASVSERGATARQGAEPATQLVSIRLRATTSKGPLGPDRSLSLSILQPSGESGGGAQFSVIAERKVDASSWQALEVPEGELWVIARAEGYGRLARRILAEEGDEYSFTFQEEESLQVRVLRDQDGELAPLSGATVLVGHPGELPFGSLTAADGGAQFQGLPRGPWRVRITARGYEPYEAVTEAELLVRLRPSSALVVRVKDGGKPVPSAELILAGAGLWPPRRVLTRADGEVEISGLSPGRYSLFAVHGDRISRETHDVEIPAQPGLVEVELHLLAGKFLAVKVVEAGSDKAVPGARLNFGQSALGQFSERAVSAEDGRARLGPLRQLEGLLQVRTQDYSPHSGWLEEEPKGEVTVELNQAATVTGRVVDEEGYPVTGAVVEVVGTSSDHLPIAVTARQEELSEAHFDWSHDWAHSTENVLIPAGELGVLLGPVPPIPFAEVKARKGVRLTTDDKGYFVAKGVPEGEVVVRARHPNYLDGKSKSLKTRAGQVSETRVVLKQGIAFRGRVLDHEEFPVGAAKLVVSAKGFSRRVIAQSDGTFSLSAPPQKLRVRVSLPDSPLRTAKVQEIPLRLRGQEVKIVLPPPREDVEVRVLGEHGEAVELAQVKIESLDPAVPEKQTRFSNNDGEVAFDRARGLSARLTVFAPGYVEAKEEKNLASEITVRLLRSVSVVARVVGVRGRLPASGAEVELRISNLARRAKADEYGEVIFVDIPPGRASYRASHEEYGKASGSVQIRRDGDRDFRLEDIQLEQSALVGGKVLDRAGRPVSHAWVGVDRLSPFQKSFSGVRTDSLGVFEIEVERAEEVYLYAASPGEGFGWSERVVLLETERTEGVEVLVDQVDAALPDERGTVLCALREVSGEISVYSVAPGSGAARAGLKAGDQITRVEGERPEDTEELRTLLSGLPGTEVSVTLRRGKKKLVLSLPRESFTR